MQACGWQQIHYCRIDKPMQCVAYSLGKYHGSNLTMKCTMYKKSFAHSKPSLKFHLTMRRRIKEIIFVQKFMITLSITEDKPPSMYTSTHLRNGGQQSKTHLLTTSIICKNCSFIHSSSQVFFKS